MSRTVHLGLILCLLCFTAVFKQGGISLRWYGVLSTLHYFHFVFTLIHYTSSLTGKVAVVAMLLPIRVDAICGDLCLLYLRILCTAYLYLTDQLAVRDCQQTYP